MNKHSSVLWLMIQSTFTKVLAVLAGTSLVQLAMYLWAFHHLSVADYGLEQVLEQGYVARVAALGFLGMSWLLSQTGTQRSGRLGYTLQRLSVSEREVFWWQTLYNGGCYLILWATQVLTMLGLGALYTRMADPFMVTNQTILLACYRSPYLYSLLPLANPIRWVRLLVLLAGLSLASAYYPFARRRGKSSSEILTLAALCLFFFTEHASYGLTYLSGWSRYLAGPWFLTWISLIVIAMVLWQVMRKGADGDDE